MTQRTAEVETKSAARLAFAHYLRTGRRLPDSGFESNKLKLERKYNHNHDPENGQFAFGSGETGGSASFARGGTPNIRPKAARPQSAGSVAPQARARQKETQNHSKPVKQTAAVPYRRADGKVYMDPRSGKAMLKPADVKMEDTIQKAKLYRNNRVAGAAYLFAPGQEMDFQRTKSNLRDKSGKVLIDKRYVAFGNYNFGAYAAASGMTLDEALFGASVVYHMTASKNRNFNEQGPYRGNPRNSAIIARGYRDYEDGKLGK